MTGRGRSRWAEARRALGTRLVDSPTAWAALERTVLHWSNLLRGRRDALARERAAALVPGLLDAATVRHGPFAGLVYAHADAFASTLTPKLLGSYERELHALIRRIAARGYGRIVDVGCAEGYYAVGFARACPGARVLACDSDPAALAACRANARANAVESRMDFAERIDGAALVGRVSTGPGRALVFCDIDGGEETLFDPVTVAGLAGADALVETHDFLDPLLTSRLRARFEPTHEVEVVEGLDDVGRVAGADYAELAPLDAEQRALVLAERRPAVQRWLWCAARVASR